LSGLVIQIGRRAGGEVDATLFDTMAPQDLLVIENEWSAERSRIMQDLLVRAVTVIDAPWIEIFDGISSI
jgi:hypothetical protein